MENESNLAELCRNISNKLIDSRYLLEIMEDLYQGDSKFEILVSYLQKNIVSSFNEIEECRKKICISD